MHTLLHCIVQICCTFSLFGFFLLAFLFQFCQSDVRFYVLTFLRRRSIFSFFHYFLLLARVGSFLFRVMCALSPSHCQLLWLLLLLLLSCYVFTRIEIFSAVSFERCLFSQQVIVVHLHEPVLLLLRDFWFVTSTDSMCWSCCKRQSMLCYGDGRIQSLHHLRYRSAIMMPNA